MKTDKESLMKAREKARQMADIMRKKAASARFAETKRYVTLEDQNVPPDEAALNDLSEVLEGFKRRAKDETARYKQATDSEFWFAVCFQTREQKEEFLTKSGILVQDKYIDGYLFAKNFGIELSKPDIKYNSGDKINTTWEQFVDEEL